MRTDGQREKERKIERERQIHRPDRHIDRNGEDFGRFLQYSADPLK